MIRLKKHRNVILGLFIVLLLFISMRMTGFERPRLSTGEALLRNAIAPLQSGVMAVGQKTNNILSQVIAFTKIQDENQRLKEEIAKLTEQNNILIEYRQENARLRKLLNLEEVENQFTMIAARVTARDIESLHQTLSINKGSSDGIKKDMPVINESGLVGRVINVTSHTSEVLLILDRESPIFYV